MRKNIFFIIGEGRCGKSSIVRALTGVYRYKRLFVRTRTGDLDIYVWPQSCQEAGYTPQQVLDFIDGTDAQEVLITLRFEPTPEMVPSDGIDYYNLIAANHNVAGVVFMSNQPRPMVRQFPVAVQPVIVPDSLSTPVNANAAEVRNGWGWI